MKKYILKGNWYYLRNGKRTRDISKWSKQWEKERKVAFKKLWWGGWVSTVFLGVDHGFGFSKKPLIFESMVFNPNTYGELDMMRYSTEREALVGHKIFVRRWSNPMFLLRRFFNRDFYKLIGR